MLANTCKNDDRPLPAGVRYATAKLCVILLAYELHRRLRKAGSGIVSMAFDPGSVTGTGFLRDAPTLLRMLAQSSFAAWMMKRAGITVGSLEVSGASLARLAVDQEYSSKSGKFFQVKDGSCKETRSATMSYDESLAATVWEESMRLSRLKAHEACSFLG